MFRKLNIISFALFTMLYANSSNALETLVHFNSELSKSGSMDLEVARYKIIPDNWVLKATDKAIYSTSITWAKGIRWTSLLDTIGRRESISFVVDGATKTVYAAKSVGILKPGVILVNSRVQAQRKLYKLTLLDELSVLTDKEILNDKKVDDVLLMANEQSEATKVKTDVIAGNIVEPEKPTSGIDPESGLRIVKVGGAQTERLVDAFSQETRNNLYIHSQWIEDEWYDHLQFKSLGQLNEQLWYDSSKEVFVFQLKKGTLKKNLEALLENTKNTKALDPSDILTRHMVFNDMQVEGETVLHLIDKIIAPYSQPSQIRGKAHPNYVVTFNYEKTTGVK
jgi:hypothetical protein